MQYFGNVALEKFLNFKKRWREGRMFYGFLLG